MSYRIYTTPAIILKRVGAGEGNVIVFAITGEMGLIAVSVQAGRTANSKLRGAAQQWGDVVLSVVHGKKGWKATGINSNGNFFFRLPVYARKTLAQLSAILQKMMPGEESHPDLYELVKSGFDHLLVVPEYDLPLFEALFMIRVLYLLGYVASDIRTEPLLSQMNEWNNGLLQSVAAEKTHVIGIINKALSASQLAG